MTTRILGIDPGLTRCGVGLIELGGSGRVSLVRVDTFKSEPNEELSVRIGRIATQIEALIESDTPAVIAIERIFSEQNLSTVMGVAQISGAVLMLAYKYGIPVVMYTPTQIKAAVTGSGRAAKSQVGFMVAKILGLTEVPKPADAADSLAIAICHAWRSPAATESKNLTKAQKVWLSAERAAATTKHP